MTSNDPLGIEKYNKSVARAGFTIRINLKNAISRLSMKGKRNLVKSLRLKLKKEYGEITQMTFQFNRHGVFFHKGVGKGHVIMGSRVVRGTKKDGMFRSLPSVSGTTVNRFPKDWFQPTLDKQVPKLADAISKNKADAMADKIINIK